MGVGTFLLRVGESQVVGVCSRLPLRPMDAPVLPGSRRLLGTAVEEPNLGQKPKLWGVRALLPFIVSSIGSLLSFCSFCLFFFVLLVCKSPKIFLLSFVFVKNLKNPKICFLCSLVCFVFRVQLESVMIIISYVRLCK